MCAECVWRSGVLVLTLVMVLAWLPTGCGLGATDNFAPLTIFDNFRAIKPGRAYRSAQLDATSLELVLGEYQIRTIVNLRGTNEDKPWYQNERRVAEELGVTLVDIPMSAQRLPPRDVLLQIYDTFVEAEEPILIHCEAGADRTGAASVIWRMVVRGDPKSAAASELSPCYGHFPAAYPAMDELVRIFLPDRDWILNEYWAPE